MKLTHDQYNSVLRALAKQKHDEMCMLDSNIQQSRVLQSEELMKYFEDKKEEIHEHYKQISLWIFENNKS